MKAADEEELNGQRNRPGGRLLERDSELEAIASALDQARTGRGSTLLLVGPAGIGKSALCAAAETLARGRGMPIRKARGGTLEREVPWGAVRELFGAPDAALMEGPAAYARSVIGDGDAPGTSDREGATLHGLYWLCAAVARREPLIMLVDDAHAVDPSSLRWLGYLAGRTGDLPLVLLIASRPVLGTGPHASILERGRHLEPRALSLAACSELLATRFGGPVPEELVGALHRASGGNPFLLWELAGEVERRNRLPVNARAADIVAKFNSRGLARSIRDRIGLGEPAHRLAEAVAVLDQDASGADSGAVARLSEKEFDAALAELIEAGILDGHLPLRFVHPLVRDALWDGVPPARRAVLHGRAVAALRARRAPLERVAAHLLHTEPAGNERTVSELRHAARAALAAGAPDFAADYLRRATAEPPPAHVEIATTLELAEAEAMLGLPSALDRLSTAAERSGERAQRASIRRRLGEGLFQAGRPVEARAAFAAALADTDDDAAATELGMLIDAMGVITGAPVRPVSSEEPAADAKPELLIARSLALISASVRGGEAAELARLAAGPGEMLRTHGPGVMFSITGSCLIWCDLLDEASAEIDAAIARAGLLGDLPGLALMRFGRSWVSYWAGRLIDALADVDVAIRAWTDEERMRGQLAHAIYWKAITLVELDELAAADQLLADTGQLESFYAASVAAARARVAIARGDITEARTHLSEVRSTAHHSPFFASSAIVPWRADEAVAAKLDGDRDAARASADEALELASRFGIARQLGIALRTKGIVEDDPSALIRSVAELESSPSRLELCRSLVDLGALLRRSGATSRAREPLRRALDLASEMHAVALARRADGELRAAGARPRRQRQSGPDALTPAERRVAELAAQGLRNRDIAQHLFLTVRTIETHLTSAYRKLDIQSRDALPASLASAAGAPRP